MTLVIGLTGRAQHGKTSAAEAILDYCTNIELTAKMYDIGQAVLRYAIENGLLQDKQRRQLVEWELQALQSIGKTQRDQNEDFWISRIFQAIEADRPDIAVIPNVRYANEAMWVREALDFSSIPNGIIIRVTSLNPNGSEYISEDRPANHPSETELHNYNADYYITARRGETALVQELAITLFNYIQELRCPTTHQVA